MQVVTSVRNPAVRAYRECVNRGALGLAPLEGFRLVEDALRAGATPVALYIAEAMAATEAGRRLAETARERGANVIIVSDDVAKRMADTRSPQGVFAMVAWAPEPAASLLARAAESERPSFIVLLDGVSDPGNVGTIVRSAAALGAAGVVVGPRCASLANPKTVRASMGSMFRVGVGKAQGSQELNEFIRQARAGGYEIMVSDAQEGVTPDELVWPGPPRVERGRGPMPAVLAIGSEAHGVSDVVLRHATVHVRLDMSGDVESLNAAAAASILIYIMGRKAARWETAEEAGRR